MNRSRGSPVILPRRGHRRGVPVHAPGRSCPSPGSRPGGSGHRASAQTCFSRSVESPGLSTFSLPAYVSPSNVSAGVSRAGTHPQGWSLQTGPHSPCTLCAWESASEACGKGRGSEGPQESSRRCSSVPQMLIIFEALSSCY